MDTPSGAEGKSDIKMAAKSARNVESAESANSVKFEVVPNFELKSASVSQIGLSCVSVCVCVTGENGFMVSLRIIYMALGMSLNRCFCSIEYHN